MNNKILDILTLTGFGLFFIYFVLDTLEQNEAKLIGFSGIKDVRDKYLKTNLISQIEFDRLNQISSSINPDNPHKYIDWLAKNYIANRTDPDIYEKLREYVSSFDFHANTRKVIEDKDINRIRNLSELINIVEKARGIETKTEAREAKKYGVGLIDGIDYKEVYKDNNYTVLEIKTYKASCYFGTGAKWCISMHQESAHWKSYKEKSVKFFFIINNQIKESEYAVAVYPNNITIEVYDKLDNLVNFDNVIQETRLSSNIFSNIFSNIIRLDTFGEFKEFLDNRGIEYNIEDGLFNILDSLSLSGLGLTKLPAFINSVKGNFNCSFNNLNSLKNAPKKVGGDFDCFSNQNLTSLEGAPRQVGRDFDCSNNNLTSLKGAPKKVGGDFDCSNNKLTSLEGAPEQVNWNFNCSNNSNLTSLKGAPEKVNENFNCSYNPNLTSLEGAPEKVDGNFNCYSNNLTSLKGAPKKVGGDFDCSNNKLTSLEGAPEQVNWNFNCSNNHNLTSLDGLGFVGGKIYCKGTEISGEERKRCVD